jgi:hypothetical protein
MTLHKYWFKFSLTFQDPHPIGTLMGCGVTAASRDNALDLLQRQVFRSHTLPLIENCIEDVELSELDSKHVLPNIGNPAQPGI